MLQGDNREVLPVRPWVRYWARMLDLYLFAWIVGIVTNGAGFTVTLHSSISELLFGMIVLFIWVLVESVSLSAWGTTPGKLFFRINVTNINGEKPSFREAMERSCSVWTRGMGFGIPFVSMAALIISYRHLVRDRIASWDRGRFVVRHARIGRARIACAVLFFGGSILLMYGMAVSQ